MIDESSLWRRIATLSGIWKYLDTVAMMPMNLQVRARYALVEIGCFSESKM